MNRYEISAMVRSETESIAHSIENDFMKGLGESAPGMSDRFGFVHILLSIALRNNTTIGKIKNAVLTGVKADIMQEYNPWLIERIVNNRFIFPRSQKHKLNATDRPFVMDVCNEILSQQHIIRELDACSLNVNITGRKISCCLQGLVKISIPGMLYRLIIQQKIQFMSARHLMLVNQI